MRRRNQRKVTIIEVLKALADPVRLRLLRLVHQRGEVACQEFFADIPKSTLSHHWRVLRTAGLIRQREDGVRRLNSLREADLAEMFPGLIEAVLRHVPVPVRATTAGSRSALSLPPPRGRL